MNNSVATRGSTYLDVELKILVHLVNIGEDVSNDAWNDALQLGVLHDALKQFVPHRVNLEDKAS